MGTTHRRTYASIVMKPALDTTMTAVKFWNAMRARAPWAARRPRLTLQHLALPEGDLRAVRDALDTVGDQLELSFELAEKRGDIVLLDADLAARMPAHLLASLADGRPVLVLSGPRGDDGQWLRHGATVERHRQQLLRQLCALSVVQRQSAPARQSREATDGPAGEPFPRADAGPPSTGFDPGFDSAFDQDLLNDRLMTESLADGQQELLRAVRRGLMDPAAPVLHASYGADANLRLDFRQRIATLDPQAQRHLRVHRELPSLVPRAAPGEGATVRELDETVWDLGIAGGNQALFEAPIDWWHRALSAPPPGAVQRCTRLPRHLALARIFEAGPATPSALRRAARIDIDDLRRFLQACLILGLVHWLPDPAIPPTQVTSGKPQ